MKILVKSARKATGWANVLAYKDCRVFLCANLTRSGSLNTGLTKEDEERLEGLLGYTPGTLAKTSEFWHTYSIRIDPNKGLELDITIPDDELKYLLLKSHKLVAIGWDKVTPGKDFVIVNQEFEAISKNKANKKKIDAIIEFRKMTPEQMRKCLKVLGINADNSSPEVVEAKLYEEIEARPELFFSRWIDNKSRDIEYLIKQAVTKNVLRKNKTTYYYGTDIIGQTIDDAILYLKDKGNSDVKAAIMAAVDAKEEISAIAA